MDCKKQKSEKKKEQITQESENRRTEEKGKDNTTPSSVTHSKVTLDFLQCIIGKNCNTVITWPYNVTS